MTIEEAILELESVGFIASANGNGRFGSDGPGILIVKDWIIAESGIKFTPNGACWLLQYNQKWVVQFSVGNLIEQHEADSLKDVIKLFVALHKENKVFKKAK
jgi:hypothetical protein